MEQSLAGRRVAFLTANEGVEQVELTSPWKAVQDAGGEPVHLAPEQGDVQGFDHLDKADVFEATVAVKNANAGDFDALVLPGGVANPDQLRTDADAISLIRSFVDQGKPIAVICHGPWTLVEAKVVEAKGYLAEGPHHPASCQRDTDGTGQSRLGTEGRGATGCRCGRQRSLIFPPLSKMSKRTA